jgi:hypothetical protein
VCVYACVCVCALIRRLLSTPTPLPTTTHHTAHRHSTHKHLYNPENFFVHPDGGGAGNNWARGYDLAEGVAEDVLDMVEREAEGSDRYVSV